MSDRKRELVDAAYALVVERGLSGLRTRDIAAKAGIHHATLHYYFATKEDVVQALADRIAEEFEGDRAHPDIDESPVRQQLKRMILNTDKLLLAHPERFQVIGELLLQASRDQATRNILMRNSRWKDRVCSLLQEGVRRGEFRPDLDVTATAGVIMTFCLGLFHQFTREPDRLSRTVEEFADFIDRGV